MIEHTNTIIFIDVQKCFVNKITDKLPQKIADHLEENSYAHVVFTQFVNKEDSNFIKQLNWHKAFGSPETDLDSRVSKFITDKNVFPKTSYSIFKSKDFLEFIKKENLNDFVFCGIDSDACVLASAFDAFDLGYKVKVLRNLCQSHSGKYFHDAAVEIINKNIQKDI